MLSLFNTIVKRVLMAGRQRPGHQYIPAALITAAARLQRISVAQKRLIIYSIRVKVCCRGRWWAVVVLCSSLGRVVDGHNVSSLTRMWLHYTLEDSKHCTANHRKDRRSSRRLTDARLTYS
jgi:hypothetical protein